MLSFKAEYVVVLVLVLLGAMNATMVELLKPPPTCNPRDLSVAHAMVMCDTGVEALADGSFCDVIGEKDGNTIVTKYECANGLWQNPETIEKPKSRERRGWFGSRKRRSSGCSGWWWWKNCAPIIKYPPTFNANCPPGDLQAVYYTTSGQTSRAVTWTVPSATDRDGSVSVRQSIGIARGGNFPGSTSGQQHIVAYEARDNDGQTATCYFSFAVHIKTCSTLSWPSNGQRECPNDNQLGSRCTYRCNEGYQLNGNSEVTCQNDANPTWTTIPTCEKITCGAPPAVDNGEATCTDQSYVYNSFCTYTCDTGYNLEGQVLTVCRADTSWLNAVATQCIDDTPPTISCQSPQIFYADRASTSTSVAWVEPEISDLTDPNPSLIKVSGPDAGANIEAGNSEYVIYKAEDADGNQSPQCTIELRVLEIPCGHPLDTLADANLRFNCSLSTYSYGDACNMYCALNLPLDGTDLIICEASTASNGEQIGYWDWGNGTMPYCRDIACPDLTPPLNGALVYDTINSRPTATMLCNNQYDIPDIGTTNFNGIFLCQDSGNWNPHFTDCPDCIETFTSRGFRLPLEVFYYSGTCGIDDDIDQKFEAIVALLDTVFGTLCPSDSVCSVYNPRIVCGPFRKKKSINRCGPDSRSKRFRCRRDTGEGFTQAVNHNIRKRSTDILRFELDIETNFNISGLSLSQMYAKADEIQLDILSPAVLQLVNNGTFDIDSWTLTNDSYRTDQYGLLYCDSGNVLDSVTICKPCPRGYYESDGVCNRCAVGQYSDAHGRSSCTTCPDGYSTRMTGSMSQDNCTKLCDPGHYSPDTFAPCAPCKLGYYQSQSAQTTCTACPTTKTTNITGRTSASDCQYFDIRVNGSTAFVDVADISLMEDMSISFWTKISGSGTPRADILIGSAMQLSIRDNIRVITDPSEASAIDTTIGASSTTAWIHTAVTWDTTNNLLSVYYRGTSVVDQMSVTPATSPLIQNGKLSVVADGDAAVMISGFRVNDGVFSQADVTMATQSCQQGDDSDVLNMDHFRMADSPGISIVTPTACDAIDECQSNPCGEHTCINEIDDFTCVCSNGWTGSTCTIPPDYCIDNECTTGATCMNTDTDYECLCPPGYSGVFCDIPPVDGVWSAWSVWNDCSVTCNSGTRTRDRTCDSPPPDPLGQDCDGDDMQVASCNTDTCPECPELARGFKVIKTCYDTATDTQTCDITCVSGYELPNGLGPFAQYTCGLETDYQWEPRDTVPNCILPGRPGRYEVTAEATYGSGVSVDDQQALIAAVQTNAESLDCSNSASCQTSVTLNDAGTMRRKRNTGTTVTVSFVISIDGTSDLKLEEYQINNTVSEGLQEIIEAIANLNSTALAINSSSGALFDVTVNGVTYAIDSNTLTFDGSVTCGVGEVVTNDLCTECPAGTYMIDDYCAYCERGTYQDLNGQTVCIECPNGNTTVTFGSTSSLQCSVTDDTTTTSTTVPSTTTSASTACTSTTTATSPTTVSTASVTTGVPTDTSGPSQGSTNAPPTSTSDPSNQRNGQDDDDDDDDNGTLLIIVGAMCVVLIILIIGIIAVILLKKYWSSRSGKVSESHADLRDHDIPRPVAPPPVFASHWKPQKSTKMPFNQKLRKDDPIYENSKRQNTGISISDLEVEEISPPHNSYTISSHNIPHVTPQRFEASLYTDE